MCFRKFRPAAMSAALAVLTTLSACTQTAEESEQALDLTPHLTPTYPPLTPAPAPDPEKLAALRQNVNHIVIIYQENWSFDGLYGLFPGANGIANAGDAVKQRDKSGKLYTTLPVPPAARRALPANLPVQPFNLAEYYAPTALTPDLVHRFYEHQMQINDGRNDRFIAYSDAGALVMSYYDATSLPEGRLAREFTLCDNFFQAAFGGSFLNHIWLIAAASPVYPNAPAKIVAKINAAGNVTNMGSANVTPDGYAINTFQPFYKPHARDAKPEEIIPPQTMPTIGESLTDAGVSWAWYSGGWDDAMAGKPDKEFKFNHQPFPCFEKYADGTAAKAEHLKDEKDFLSALKDGSLPGVSYVKALGPDDEHPNYSGLQQGQQHVADLVTAVRASSVWKNTVIIITYDENGGRWDHVAPPVADRFGPGSRVPTIVISPFARNGFVDHTQYDSTSTLKLIELRWNLKPLSARDAAADGMLNALAF